MSTATATPPRHSVSLPLPVFDRLCRKHRLAARDVPALESLVYQGVAPSDTLRHKLRKTANYAACLKAILQAMSEAYFKEKGIRFPPASYKVPRGYKFAV